MKVFSLSDVGRVRETNEDYCYCSLDDRLFIVADGLGGHNAGEVAAKKAVEIISSDVTELMNKEEFVFDRDMETILDKVNREIMESANKVEAYSGMATTLVMAHIDGDVLNLAHIGDSRAYLIESGKIVQLTKDHSLVEELVKIGSISKDEAKNHPSRNIITSALGTKDKFLFDINAYKVTASEYLVLCTDGLSDVVNDDRILEIVTNHESIQEVCHKLVETANEAGGYDNITVICVEL
jgi:protein phosphatase